MSNSRIWIYRALIILSVGYLLLTWFLPWWSCDVDAIHIKDAAVIHPYGLVNNMGGYAAYVEGYTDLPAFLIPFLWGYLGVACIAAIIAAFLKDQTISIFGKKFNLGKLLIGIIGFSYIVVVIAAILLISAKLKVLGLPLVGKTWISMGTTMESSFVTGRLLLGYWLACSVGPLFIILALLRNKIIGKAK